jgi:large subunit ribosomal protein L2
MTLVKTKPTSAGRRFVIKVVNSELSKGKPYRPLMVEKKRTGGRNNNGRMTVRYRGGGHKRRYRLIDFKRDKRDVIGRIERFEYDPNRSAYIALVLYMDGERRYIIAPQNVRRGDEIVAGDNVPIKPGNNLPLRNMPVGTIVHCVELRPGKGAQLARSAGAYAQYVAREGNYAMLKLRSGEMRKVFINCCASVGMVSNNEHNLRSLGKAGAKRWRGRKSHVRGVAQNPVDHPLGGGEGKSSGGRHPVSPWGQPAKGYKTRRNKRTNKYIIKRRKKKE